MYERLPEYSRGDVLIVWSRERTLIFPNRRHLHRSRAGLFGVSMEDFESDNRL